MDPGFTYKTTVEVEVPLKAETIMDAIRDGCGPLDLLWILRASAQQLDENGILEVARFGDQSKPLREIADLLADTAEKIRRVNAYVKQCKDQSRVKG